MADDVVGTLDHLVPAIEADALEDVVAGEDPPARVGPREEELLDPERNLVQRGGDGARSRLHCAVGGRSLRRVFGCHRMASRTGDVGMFNGLCKLYLMCNKPAQLLCGSSKKCANFRVPMLCLSAHCRVAGK